MATTSLPESLTVRDATETLAALRQSFQEDASPVWRIDASGVKQVDSAAVAVLLECRRLAAAASRGMELDGAPPRLMALARLYGVEDLIGAPAAAAA